MKRSSSVWLSLLLALVVVPARAGNGLNDIGYGSESAGLAGADLALARDTAALNTNPAGLVQIAGRRLDLLMEPYVYVGHRHKDALGNDASPDNPVGLISGGGYAQRIAGTPLVAGVGLFVQGGTGFVYEDFKTPFGNRDDFSAISGSFKLTPGVAWKINEQWSLGLAGGLLYSSSRQKVFPTTSTADFSGYRADGLSGVSVNAKFGVQYRPSPDWVVGAAYTTKGPIRLEDGTVTVDYRGSGGDRVKYADARQTGLAFAPELGLGVLHRFSPRLSLVAELNWLDWSSVMQTTRLSARNPDGDGTEPPRFEAISPLDWRDQYLAAIGGLYRWSSSTELRAGFSYARSAVPGHTLAPTFAAIGEGTITAGFAHTLNANWSLSTTGMYQYSRTIEYDSALTGSSSEKWGVTALYITLSRIW